MKNLFKISFWILILLLPVANFAQAVTLSQDFLYAVKSESTYDNYVEKLATIDKDVLLAELTTEDEKKAFWLNIYNAYIQIKAKEETDLLKNNRSKFFGEKWIIIAGKSLSFDILEHGIIRHSKVKLSMGYIKRWFPSKFEKQFRLKDVDYHIHFALNCGAKGCPPIAFYTPENINEELNTATASFLQLETKYNPGNNEVEVTKLMSWFSADFGGKKGVRKILKEFDIIPQDVKPKISYRDYDWTVLLDNYR